jgi:membrane fusion protein, heavy metal efflux system
MQKQLFIIPVLCVLFSCSNVKTESIKENSKATLDGKEAQVNENIVTLTAEQEKNAAIATARLELQNISSTLKVSGQVEVPPENMVAVSVPLGGYLSSTRLLPGMQVKKGQSIAVIQDQHYIQMQQDYLTAKARLAYLEKEYQRQGELNQSKATSDKQYQQTEADYKIQQAVVKGLYEKLRLININPDKLNAGDISRSVNVYAPISGFISKVNVSAGKYVNPTDVLFEIIDPGNIHLTLNVFEKDINKLQLGQRVVAYSISNPNKKYVGKIRLINRDVSPDRSAEVHCHFENSDKDLVPGMFMNAEIEQNNYKALTLPEEAVVNYENQLFVFVARGNNHFEIIPVQTGESQNERVEIKGISNELQQNRFVIKGAYTLLMKLRNTEE